MALALPAPFADSPANRAALARAQEALGAARAGFAALEAGALAARDPLEAAALARAAYTYGMFEHPGLLASGPLERLLHGLGREHVGGTAVPAAGGVRAASTPGAGGPATGAQAGGARGERVLHVATVVYETGGHGRVLERWLERDAARTPTVLLLKDDEPVPDGLRRAVAAAGGGFAPSLPAADLFTKARMLRALAAAHDLVVLHVSNHEVVIPLAFADPEGRPPTILCNHASHQLWTGVGCADVVANLNDFDAACSVARRGVAPERSLVLRAPAAPRALPSREAARRALGLDPDAPVVLTIASPYKLRAVLEPAYADLAGAVLDAVPDATLLLVGPEPGDPIAPPAADGRVRALGRLPDVGPQLAAADLLLDSWPVTGGTTALDAGAAGLPVLALGDPPPEMVGAPEDLLGGFVARAASVAELGERAAALLADPPERARLAAAAAELVAQRHGDGWAAEMERVVATAREHHGAAAPPPADAALADTAATSAALRPAASADAALASGGPAGWESVIQLVRDGHEQGCTPELAYAWNVPELPPARRPRTGAEVVERVAAMRAAAAPA
jgi:glycosyltransferase involved in cell wall biosynthesis